MMINIETFPANYIGMVISDGVVLGKARIRHFFAKFSVHKPDRK